MRLIHLRTAGCLRTAPPRARRSSGDTREQPRIGPHVARSTDAGVVAHRAPSQRSGRARARVVERRCPTQRRSGGVPCIGRWSRARERHPNAIRSCPMPRLTSAESRMHPPAPRPRRTLDDLPGPGGVRGGDNGATGDDHGARSVATGESPAEHRVDAPILEGFRRRHDRAWRGSSFQRVAVAPVEQAHVDAVPGCGPSGYGRIQLPASGRSAPMPATARRSSAGSRGSVRTPDSRRFGPRSQAVRRRANLVGKLPTESPSHITRCISSLMAWPGGGEDDVAQRSNPEGRRRVVDRASSSNCSISGATWPTAWRRWPRIAAVPRVT